MSKKCHLTLEPLSLDILKSFDVIDIQQEDKAFLIESFSDGLPPHQGCFSVDGVPILLIGITNKTEECGLYWTWTLFGKSFHPKYYKSIIKQCNHYRSLLALDGIYHIIDVGKPWTRKMAKIFGFKFYSVVSDKYEMWVI